LPDDERHRGDDGAEDDASEVGAPLELCAAVPVAVAVSVA
jgi:hypothetical protein